MGMRTIYLIRDANSGTWLVSQRLEFSKDINNAAVYHQSGNALKSIRSVMRRYNQYPIWSCDRESFSPTKLTGYKTASPLKLEAVPFKLVELT